VKRPSSSPSDTRGDGHLDDPASGGLFGALFSSPAVDREISTGAWLQALLDVESALAAAEARAGLVPGAAAYAITSHCSAPLFDAASVARRATSSGNPVVPLVRDLTALVPAHAKPYVHLGATSQDIIDTAAMLIAWRALGPVLADLEAAGEACAALATEHRHTVMAGRTLMQQALPVTFGLKAAGWLVSLDQAAGGLAEIRASRLPVQFGGGAGTLASIGDDGSRVAALLARELGLAEPILPWHTDRVPVASLAGALGTAAGVLSKIARDVLLLSQTEVAEVAEGGEAGHGGSSTMPHKRNPVGAVLVTAGARRVPGLVATLFASMDQEHERAAGAWHAEWETLTELLRLTGGAAAHARTLVAGLSVHAGRMRENLGLTHGAIMSESVASRLAPALGRTGAQELTARASRQAAERGTSLRDALLAEPAVREHLSPGALDAALDPAAYLGSAPEFIDRALAAHRRGHPDATADGAADGAADGGTHYG
jgi:3-carboxy-cis,cis-muconate cycloisomerase